MKLRIDHMKANPEAYKTMLHLERFIKESGLDPILYELIKIRASQLNGCSFCLDMHTRDLRKMGETEQRIYLLSVWRETNLYSGEERAALELTEALTELPKNGLPDDVYERVRAVFDETQFVTLIMAINAINCWNRLGVATGMFPGYR
ncbi:carboxymuconolactone decarboxylase family protein [Paenibacillus humicola]|uniref:carboxymuconolactone decarboxylase family protein n=1 Tax=Paenibacillus humicola TaxID=3110540 RepID=UPI00237B714A|nr:carboxymuconolactone decarboxylase family protein [Paenibacillus humicola]